MCECGCGELHLLCGWRIKGIDCILAIRQYTGCKYCDTGVAHDIFLFTQKGWDEWGQGVPILGDFTPDENGGQVGGILIKGVTLPMIGREELEQATLTDRALDDCNPEEYLSLDELLREWGLEIIQSALEEGTKRWRKAWGYEGKSGKWHKRLASIKGSTAQ